MMLRRIHRDQLRVGMYIHAIDGSWFEHPFWRRRFLLSKAEEVDAIRESKIETLYIDTAKGLDVVCATEHAPTTDMSDKAAPLSPGAIEGKDGDTAHEDSSPSSDKTLTGAELVADRSMKAIRNIFNDVRLGTSIRSEVVREVVEDIAGAIARNSNAFLNVVRLKSKDEYTYMHSVAVCALMVSLARQLGLDKQTTADLGTAGLLHDVGKMAIPIDVLNKPGRLSDDEFMLVKTHPEHGHRMLCNGGDIPETALDVCLHHHEKFDGTGYPHKLQGSQISLASRMGAICDVYDAITSNRPYKNAWSPLEAITRMQSWEGHFDRKLMFAFQLSIGIVPVGTVVQLAEGRLAVVVDSGGGGTRPKLLTFYSTRKRKLSRTELTVLSEGQARTSGLIEASLADWDIPQKTVDGFVQLGAQWVKQLNNRP